MRPGPSSVGSDTRQKPALWSDTQVRPAGSTRTPAETCSPVAYSEAPAACASGAAAAKASVAPTAAPAEGSAEARRTLIMWLFREEDIDAHCPQRGVAGT